MNIPEGFKLVPVEPTSEMVLAGINTELVETGDEEFDQQEDYRRVWRSMVEDAPTPPQPIYDEETELNRMFGAAREMLRIAGIASQGSNAYNRAIVNLHEAVTACAKSRAKAGEVGHE